jgi:integrase
MRVRGDLLALVESDVYTPGTANSLLDAAQGIMAEVWRLSVGRPPDDKYLDAEALEVIRQVEAIPGKRMRRQRRTLTDAEIATLLAHCAADLTPRGQRDAALVAMAAATGLRASEYAALELADYDREGVRLRIPQIKTEISDQEVWLPFASQASEYLDRWLARRGKAVAALTVAVGLAVALCLPRPDRPVQTEHTSHRATRPPQPTASLPRRP